MEPSFNVMGLILSGVNLTLSAMQGNLQEKCLRDHDASIMEAMLYTNGRGGGGRLSTIHTTTTINGAFTRLFYISSTNR